MDNATLSLLNSPIFWTFFVLGVLALLGSMLVSYSPPKRKWRNLNEAIAAPAERDDWDIPPPRMKTLGTVRLRVNEVRKFKPMRDEHEAGGIGS